MAQLMTNSSQEHKTSEHFDVRTESFLVQHDLTFMRDALINKRLSLKHIKSISTDTNKLDQLCQTLGLDFCQKVKLDVALEEKSMEDNLDNEFKQLRKKYIVTSINEKYLQIYHSYSIDFVANYDDHDSVMTLCQLQTFTDNNEKDQSLELINADNCNCNDKSNQSENSIANYLPQLNVMVVGESGAGKTTMVFKMTREDYIFAPNNVPSTVAVDGEEVMIDIGELGHGYRLQSESGFESGFELKTDSTLDYTCNNINDTDNTNCHIVLLQIWDSAGMERFNSGVLNQSIYRKQNAIVLCYDVGNKKSFDALKNWYKNITAFVDPNRVAIFVIGCKKDTIHDGSSNRYVLSNEAKKYAASIGAQWSDCSAKTGQGIVETLLLIAERAYKRKRWLDQNENDGCDHSITSVDLHQKQKKKNSCCVK